MIEIPFVKARITRTFSGGYEVTIEVDKDQANNINLLNEFLTDNDKVKTCKIDNKKKRRSLNANAYAWTLITEIANKLRADKEEIYLMMLKRYGQSSIVSVVDEAVEMFVKSVKYAEKFGSGVVNGKDFTHIKVFMGSSDMDNKQFSIFLDGIVSEAEQLGIQTMTEKEIQQLKEQWGR